MNTESIARRLETFSSMKSFDIFAGAYNVTVTPTDLNTKDEWDPALVFCVSVTSVKKTLVVRVHGAQGVVFSERTVTGTPAERVAAAVAIIEAAI